MDASKGRVFAIGTSKHHQLIDALIADMAKQEETKTMGFEVMDEFMKYAYDTPKMTPKEFIAQTKRTKPKGKKKRSGKKKR